MAAIMLLITLALSTWGVIFPPQIRAEFFQNDIGALAQVGCYEENKCIIGIYQPGYERLTEDEKRWLINHEVGHTLGLPDFGDCNSMYANMGCWWHPITDYDRLRYSVVSGQGYRLTMPMVSNESTNEFISNKLFLVQEKPVPQVDSIVVGWNLLAIGDGINTPIDINNYLLGCVTAIWSWNGTSWYGWFPDEPIDPRPRFESNQIYSNIPLQVNKGYWVYCNH